MRGRRGSPFRAVSHLGYIGFEENYFAVPSPKVDGELRFQRAYTADFLAVALYPIRENPSAALEHELTSTEPGLLPKP